MLLCLRRDSCYKYPLLEHYWCEEPRGTHIQTLRGSCTTREQNGLSHLQQRIMHIVRGSFLAHCVRRRQEQRLVSWTFFFIILWVIYQFSVCPLRIYCVSKSLHGPVVYLLRSEGQVCSRSCQPVQSQGQNVSISRTRFQRRRSTIKAQS